MFSIDIIIIEFEEKNSKNNESILWYHSKIIWMLCNIFTFLGWWPFPLCSLQRRCVGNENIQCKAEFEYSQFFTPQYIPIPQPFINVYRKFKSLEWFVKFWFQFGTWTSIICFCKYSNWLQHSGKMSVALMFSSCNQAAQWANWHFQHIENPLFQFHPKCKKCRKQADPSLLIKRRITPYLNIFTLEHASKMKRWWCRVAVDIVAISHSSTAPHFTGTLISPAGDENKIINEGYWEADWDQLAQPRYSLYYLSPCKI